MPEHLAQEIASRAACAVSPNYTVDRDYSEEGRRLRRWRRIARYSLERTPDNADAWIVLGHSECRCAERSVRGRRQRRFEAAKRAYRVAAKLKRDAWTWISLGQVGVHSSDLATQFAAFRTALEIEPANAFALWCLGKAHAEAGEHHEAVRLLRQSIELMGEVEFAAIVCADLSLSDLRLGNVEDALKLLLKSVDLDRGHYFELRYPEIAETFFGHDQPAAEFRDLFCGRLSAIRPFLADQFYAYFQPRIGTVTHAKGSWRIVTAEKYGLYFILMEEAEAAGIPHLRVGDRVEFQPGLGRKVPSNSLKLLPRALTRWWRRE
jgi:tetratricopeptide (TPR) repeat protein